MFTPLCAALNQAVEVGTVKVFELHTFVKAGLEPTLWSCNGVPGHLSNFPVQERCLRSIVKDFGAAIRFEPSMLRHLLNYRSSIIFGYLSTVSTLSTVFASGVMCFHVSISFLLAFL